MTDRIVIDRIKRKGRNFLLYPKDGGEILLTGHIIDRYKLKVGIEIEDSLLNEIKHESDIERANQYISYLLARRAYPTGLIKSKMEEKGYSKRVIENIIRGYLRKGVLDDTVFAREMTESILRNKPAGRNYIIAKLRQKRIPRQMAETIVNEIMEKTDESELAYRLLTSRWRYFSKFELETARQKAYNYLSRRTINYRAAKTAFEKILEEVGQN